MTDTIQKDRFVALTYRITDESGDILELTDIPVEFVYGRDNQVIDKIAEALAGKREGDEISVTLSPDEGFGEYLPELTFSDDLDNVPEEFHHIGAEVEFQNDHGETRMFRVTRIDDGKLTVDGNHPFAGKTVTYRIKITQVRDATADEIANGVTTLSSLH